MRSGFLKPPPSYSFSSPPYPLNRGFRTRVSLIRQTIAKYATKRPYSPYADRKFPDAAALRRHASAHRLLDGCRRVRRRLTPRDAYRFARGEQVMASSGQPAKLSRPLDFLVVADHSDNMGFFPDLLAGKPELLADPTGRKWYDMIQSGKGAEAALEIIGSFLAGQVPEGR